MIELPANREWIRPWVVCEATDRWLTAIRRFAPEMMPAPLIPAIQPVEPPKARELLAGEGGPAVILWEVGDSLAAACDCLARTAITSPQLLQWVAGPALSDRERIMLSEFGCAAVIRHPEDLPKLTRMVHVYFATSDQHLD